MKNKTFTFKKRTPITIDRFDFDFKGVDFTYRIEEGVFEKTHEEYHLLKINISDDDLHRILDDYHYEYLQEATNGNIYLDLKQFKGNSKSFFLGHKANNYIPLEDCESDKLFYESFKDAIKEKV
tara:strand:+ start:345 stop:716 length:372 start_codon:yes stop_codon:yes gene_type:complete